MPFDNTPEGRLTLADLSWRLRNPETWPADFVWDYLCCASCAMGLAYRLSDGPEKCPFEHMSMTGAFKLTLPVLADIEPVDVDPLRAIFLTLQTDRFKPVSPKDVADAIDRHLKSKVSVHA
jgi:hypothetical protein